MSDRDRDKWNQRYAARSYHNNNPVAFLADWVGRIPMGRALDVACGAGRNAVFLAQAGYQVDAIDISCEGLALARQHAEALGLSINWIEHDLDRPYRFDTDYDLIVMTWYVNPVLLSRLCDSLAPGGYLLCEEHLVTDEDVIGPTGLKYRVAPGELSKAASGLEIVSYEEAIRKTAEDERIASARLVARKD